MESSSGTPQGAVIPVAIPQHLKWLWDWYASQLTCLIAELGIADVLGETPQTAEALAEQTSLDAAALGRLLRFISDFGVFEEIDGRFRHSPLSRLMRADHPQSLRP